MIGRDTENEQNIPSVMTIQELCDYVRIHRSTAYRLISIGKLPFLRIGGNYRFDREEVDQWLRKSK
jgi:excisionase family DNA binding protein